MKLVKGQIRIQWFFKFVVLILLLMFNIIYFINILPLNDKYLFERFPQAQQTDDQLENRRNNNKKVYDGDNADYNSDKYDYNEGKEIYDVDQDYDFENNEYFEENSNSDAKTNPKVIRKEVPIKTEIQPDHNYDGFYHQNETTKTGKAILKVILLTYQRSGSSFAGQLLSSGGDTFYVYEPLFQWRKVLGPHISESNGQDYARILGDLLDCKPKVIKAWKKKGFTYFRTKPEGKVNYCGDAEVRILKTIRARARFVTSWLLKRPDIKVIHLIRDPRAVLNSVLKGGHLWGENNKNISLYCQYVKDDFLMGKRMGKQRYIVTKYEDLVTNQFEETKKIFNFMNREMSSTVVKYINDHNNGSDILKKQPNYLNTYRNKDFDPNHWKKTLSSTNLKQINLHCKKIMDIFGYK